MFGNTNLSAVSPILRLIHLQAEGNFKRFVKGIDGTQLFTAGDGYYS